MKRRDFINKFGLSAGAVVAAGITGCGNGAETAQETTEAAKDTTATKPAAVGIQTYTAIGATGLKMSDISMGCGGLSNPYTVEHAIDVGINYFDTAPDYGSGASEEALGKVFAESSKRDKCIIVSKYCKKGRYGVHLDRGTPEAEIIEEVEGSLKRLQTDRIEFMMVHAIGERENDRERLLDPEMLSATAKLKEQGKILHLATSSHGPNDMEGLLIDAIESGYYDMFMPALNFMEFPKLGDVLAKAKERNVGVVAMKTLAGAEEEDLSKFKDENTSLAEAAFKWVFTQPAVCGLVITMKSALEIDMFVAASGQRFSAADRKVLDEYSNSIWSQYCRTGCGDCQSHCPHGVAVASILRYDMYFSSYRDHLKALTEYRDLPAAMKPNACAECDAPCNKGCQFGVPVQARLLQAAEHLEFA
jgi:aryl-alcohol dehydrogenase-like predicted oxidoreductase